MCFESEGLRSSAVGDSATALRSQFDQRDAGVGPVVIPVLAQGRVPLHELALLVAVRLGPNPREVLEKEEAGSRRSFSHLSFCGLKPATDLLVKITLPEVD